MAGDDVINAGMAGRYSRALFELALETGQLEVAEADLNRMQQLIGESPELARALASPLLDETTKMNAVIAVAQAAGLSMLTMKFLALLAQNRRLRYLSPDIIAAFQALMRRRRGEVRAHVISAQPLNAAQQAALQTQLSQAAGKAVKLDMEVQPDLLGGLIVRLGSKMLDASLKTKLNRLQSLMREVG